MELDVTKYDVIEYHMLRTVIKNEEAGIPVGFEYAGCKEDEARDIEEREVISLPKTKDGNVVFKVEDINFDKLKGVHSWRLMKDATQGGPAPLSERKAKECLSYLVSEEMLNYRSDKRYYLTPKGASTFLKYATGLAENYWTSEDGFGYTISSEE